jgi:hypothetical protein
MSLDDLQDKFDLLQFRFEMAHKNTCFLYEAIIDLYGMEVMEKINQRHHVLVDEYKKERGDFENVVR